MTDPLPNLDAPTHRELHLVGRTISGKYRLERIIGQGSMGAVYTALQIALDKTVAIKVLRPEYANDRTFAERFHLEAKAASRLDHPNSVRVLDYGVEPDGLPYIAMEYLDGKDLNTLLAERFPLPRARVVDILSQALSALAVAHDMGILHRDVKPENIMITKVLNDESEWIDYVKVCDFGIAKVFREVASPEGRSTGGGMKLTVPGLVIGTPSYMSPEQARGEALDHRSDLYSIGVILYELLAGRVPFDAETHLGIALRHVSDEPVPPSLVFADADKELEAVCLRAMSKQPADRYQTAREMRVALRDALAESLAATGASVPRARTQRPSAPAGQYGKTELQLSVQTVPPPAPRGWRGRRTVLAGLSAAALAAMVAGSLGHFGHQAPRSVAGPLQELAVPPTSTADRRAAVTPETTAAPPVAFVDPAGPSTADASRPRSMRVAERRGAGIRTSSTPPTLARAAAVAEPPAAETAPEPAPPEVPATPSLANTPSAAAPPPATVAATAAPGTPPASPETLHPAVAVPAYDPASARVELGAASNLFGDTSTTKVLGAVGRISGKLNACYQAALPRIRGPVEGTGVLHIETNDVGRVNQASLRGPAFVSEVADCVVAAAKRCVLEGVDTGSASADVALTFKAR